MPAEKDAGSERPTEVLTHIGRAERKHSLEQSLALLKRLEERLEVLIERQQGKEEYRNASFTDFASVVGVSMRGVQRVDSTPVAQPNEPNLLRYVGRPLSELRSALLLVKSEKTAIQQALRHMEYHAQQSKANAVHFFACLRLSTENIFSAGGRGDVEATCVEGRPWLALHGTTYCNCTADCSVLAAPRTSVHLLEV